MSSLHLVSTFHDNRGSLSILFLHALLVLLNAFTYWEPPLLHKVSSHRNNWLLRIDLLRLLRHWHLCKVLLHLNSPLLTCNHLLLFHTELLLHSQQLLVPWLVTFAHSWWIRTFLQWQLVHIEERRANELGVVRVFVCGFVLEVDRVKVSGCHLLLLTHLHLYLCLPIGITSLSILTYTVTSTPCID